MFHYLNNILVLIFFPGLVWTQGSFAPPVGQPGTTAIHKDSSDIVAWATACTVIRGYQDIADTSLGLTTVGTTTDALGIADGSVISLGDSGVAILTFTQPIVNGPGPDFAVFENAFNDDFLELALVEVSSDGVNFYRFPPISEIQDTIQTSGFGTTDATQIHNLAGKYRAQYGTPFDLEDLASVQGLDVNHITHVKIIDVIGSINYPFAVTDQYGTPINDPYPTAFASGGFDLDAVGVLHQYVSIEENESLLSIYPNPVNDLLQIISEQEVQSFVIFDVNGREILHSYIPESKVINVSALPKGIYYMKVEFKNGYKANPVNFLK